MPAVAWMLLTALGFWILKNMPRIRHRTIRAVSVRAAAILFLVAGGVTAGGFVGGALASLVHATQVVGAGLAWILFFLGALSWLAGMVPENWFRGDVPDWLSISGLALPSLLASVPGPIGAGMTTAMHATSGIVGGALNSLFGVHA